MKIGEVIKELRKKKKEKQRELAEAIDVSPTFLSQIEKGHRAPSRSLLEKVASHYNFPLSGLLLKSMIAENIINDEKSELLAAASPIVDYLIQILLPGEPKKKDGKEKIQIKNSAPSRTSRLKSSRRKKTST